MNGGTHAIPDIADHYEQPGPGGLDGTRPGRGRGLDRTAGVPGRGKNLPREECARLHAPGACRHRTCAPDRVSHRARAAPGLQQHEPASVQESRLRACAGIRQLQAHIHRARAQAGHVLPGLPAHDPVDRHPGRFPCDARPGARPAAESQVAVEGPLQGAAGHPVGNPPGHCMPHLAR